MDDKIKIIKRQTNYNEDEIKELMKKHNNNVEQIIMEYHGIDVNKKNDEEFSKLSNNQKIFRTIRDFF
tara:strand:+ start:905 stop:1108 length:204 start_codon:yes stop_codon:yes gene_type:complete